MKPKVALLFLGETLLMPHLYPIVEALAQEAPDLPIDLWVSTATHEVLLGRWTAGIDAPNIRMRRAPGFRAAVNDADGRNPPLPAKIPLLLRLAPALARTPIVVSAEQTSLWLPALLPLRTRFVNTLHGAGSMMNRKDRRRRAPWLTLVPSEHERDLLTRAGVERIAVTGYVKADFRHRTHTRLNFAQPRPTVLYTPHWQQHRSSWWRWGPEAVRRIVESGRYNLIFAPHQRLVERAPEVRALCAALAGRDDVHCDLDSFAMVDGSYTRAADIYLGDTSSQVVEFLMTPRPCLFLNAQEAAWHDDPSYAIWRTGEVIDDLDLLLGGLSRAPARHRAFAAIQRDFTAEWLGDISGSPARRAAAEIIRSLP